MEPAGRNPNAEQLREKYPWAFDAVKRHFKAGLDSVSDSGFLNQRFSEFQQRNDPIYADLLGGMGDDLAKTFVSYWVIAQTIATQSRFWLEAAVAEIVSSQARQRGRQTLRGYTHGLPARRSETVRQVSELIGPFQAEDFTQGVPPEVPLSRDALHLIDVLVGEQEREAPGVRQRFRRREWNREDDAAARKRDRSFLAQVANSKPAPPNDLTRLKCNLLVIEPDLLSREAQVWAIRFVNPKTIAQHATRKQERVNLLRLCAWLVQEKLVPKRASIHVQVAELVPRHVRWEWMDHYPDYFSPLTYWSSERLWEFIGVPFGVVQAAIRDVARGNLQTGLQKLLPGHSEAAQKSTSGTLDSSPQGDAPKRQAEGSLF